MAVKIFIDPGHGGSDPGAVGGGYFERNLNLSVSFYLREYLLTHYQDVDVLLSRTSNNTTLSLSQRTNMANNWGAHYLISVHFNAGVSSARGYEDYIYNGLSDSSTSAKHRDTIHNEVKGVLSRYGIPNRGRKKANFHMVRETRMSAILVETLFVSNPTDQRLCSNITFLKDIAAAYARGIAKAFNLRAKQVVKPAPAPSTGTIYRVQVGAFRDKENAIDLQKRLQSDGYSSFIYS